MSRPFWGWRIVAGAFLVLCVAYGAQYSFGIFFAALLDEFHWSRATLSGAFSLYAFTYSVVGFPAGRLTDRYGPRAIITVGGAFLGGALAAMAWVDALWQPYALYLVAALGMGTAYVPCNSTVVKWFARRRGIAIGLASAGGSVGTLLLPPVAQTLVARGGWRAAYVVFGVAIFAVLAAVASVMRRDPESVGQWPDGEPPPRHDATADDDAWPLARAMRTPSFWLVGAAFTVTWIPVFIPLVHLVPLARDLGHSPLAGAFAVSMLGAGAVIGRLVMGGVSDRVGRKPTIAAAMLMQALSFAALALARDLPALYAAAVAFGYSYGTVSTLFPAIIGDFFGRAQAGTLVGFLFAIAGSMAAWGPLVAGAVYDATGGYGLALALAAALNVAAAAILAVCRKPGAALREAVVGG